MSQAGQDFGDWLENNEGDLLDEFIGDHSDDSEMLAGTIKYVVRSSERFDNSFKAIEAFICADKVYSRKFEEWAREQYDSKCWMSGEPEAREDR